jgi:hypothetical protein
MTQRPPERKTVTPSHSRKKFVPIFTQQRHIPANKGPETEVFKFLYRKVRNEEDREVDLRTGRDAAQEWRLVLNRMRYYVCYTERPKHQHSPVPDSPPGTA